MGWLVSTGRQRLVKIARGIAVVLVLLAMLVVAAVVGGVNAMVPNFLVNIVVTVGVAAGSRVEGSNRCHFCRGGTMPRRSNDLATGIGTPIHPSI